MPSRPPFAMTLDPRAPEPLYHQLRIDLLSRIETGEFGPGERIPTEMEICEYYGVSRSTARQALRLLADEEILIRARRRGTIVNPEWRRNNPTDVVHLVLSDSYREDDIRSAISDDRNVHIDVVAYNEIREYLLWSIAEGTAPDIAMIDHVWVAEFAQGHMIHALHDLDRAWAENVLESVIHPSAAKAYLYDEALYAVPEEVNLAGVWYDRMVLDELGVRAPRTWDELLVVATAVKELQPDRYPIALPGGEAARETTTYCHAALLASNNTAIIDGAVTLDSADAVTSLRFLRHLVESGLVDPSAHHSGWLDAPHALGEGRIAIEFGGSYEMPHIASRSDLSVDTLTKRYLFRPFPAGPVGREATVIGGMGYAIFRQSRDPYSALDLLKEIAAPERLDARSLRQGTISPTGVVGGMGFTTERSVVDNEHILDSAWTRPVVPGYPAVTKQIQRMVGHVIAGTLRPAAAVERTAEFIGHVTDLPVVHG